jgi:hypothetical protein
MADPAYVAYVDGLLRKRLEERGHPELFDTLRRVVRTESNYDPNAVSIAGAKGLLQMLDGTAAEMGVRDVFDPEQNVRGGVDYFVNAYEKYGSVQAAAFAYNAGPGNYEAYLQGRYKPVKETVDYVRAVSGGDIGTGGGAPVRQPEPRKPKPPEPSRPQANPLATLLQREDQAAEEAGRAAGTRRPTDFLWTGGARDGPSGLSFMTREGVRAVAHPETASEATELEGFSRYGPRERGQLLSVAPMFRQVKSRLDSNRFLRYPDYYDGDIRELVRRSGGGR